MRGRLDELALTNLGVIDSARIEPTPGLVVVTGETGAGKTLLLGAIELLLGLPARSGLITAGSDDATVEGRFLVDGEEITVTRRLAREGRSRAYLDGSMVPLKVVAERIADLVEIVAQGDQFALRSSAAWPIQAPLPSQSKRGSHLPPLLSLYRQLRGASTAAYRSLSVTNTQQLPHSASCGIIGSIGT